MRRLVVSILLVGLPAAAEAQWRITPNAGYILFQEETALEGMPVGGIEVMRAGAGPFGFGFGLDYARGEIDGALFPPAQLDFGIDSTVAVVVNQSAGMLGYWARGELTTEVGRFSPYAGAGAGGYTLFLNAQQWDAPETLSGLMVVAGVGARIAVGESSSIVLDVRDLIFPSFDANDLNVVREQSRNDRFPELNPAPLEETTAHNIRLSLGFQFLQGGGR